MYQRDQAHNLRVMVKEKQLNVAQETIVSLRKQLAVSNTDCPACQEMIECGITFEETHSCNASIGCRLNGTYS